MSESDRRRRYLRKKRTPAGPPSSMYSATQLTPLPLSFHSPLSLVSPTSPNLLLSFITCSTLPSHPPYSKARLRRQRRSIDVAKKEQHVLTLPRITITQLERLTNMISLRWSIVIWCLRVKVRQRNVLLIWRPCGGLPSSSFTFLHLFHTPKGRMNVLPPQ